MTASPLQSPEESPKAKAAREFGILFAQTIFMDRKGHGRGECSYLQITQESLANMTAAAFEVGAQWRSDVGAVLSLPASPEGQKSDSDHVTTRADQPSTAPPQEGIWTLTAPDGRTWQADKPLRCIAAESRERIPAEVALQRIFDAAHEDHDWLPMDSAPKHGTRVILSWGGKSITGFYLDNSKTSVPWEGWRVESMVPQPAGKPTHWQPFPAAPSKEKA